MPDKDFTSLLSNCPFCDAKPIVKYIGNDHSKSRKIEITCKNHRCRAKMVNAAMAHGFGWLEDVSMGAWNRRA